MKMTVWAGSVALGLLLTACGQGSQTSESKAIIPVDPQSTLDLGKGLDTLSGAIKGDCVIRTEPETVFASNGRSVRMSIDKIESSQDLFQKLDFSAEANYGNMISGKASYAKSIKVNDFSVYVIGKVNVQLMTQSMRDIQLKPDAYQLASDSYSRFLERCGNDVVSGRTTGGELFVVLEIITHSKEEKRKIEASLQGSYGVFSGSASFSQNLENIIKSSETTFRLYQDGGVYTSTDLTADQLIQKVVNFPNTVQPNNGWAVSVTTVSYKTLALPTIDNSIDLEHRQNVLKDYLSLSLAYEDYRNSIQFMLNNPTQFVNLDSVLWNQKLIQTAETLNTIARRSSTCYNLTKACELNQDITYPNKAELPQRVENAPVPNVTGCMDPNGSNYVKAANQPATCDYTMNAEVLFQNVGPSLGQPMTKNYLFKTSGLRSDLAVSECMTKYGNMTLRDHRGGSTVTYKAIKANCTFRKPLVLVPDLVIDRPILTRF